MCDEFRLGRSLPHKVLNSTFSNKFQKKIDLFPSGGPKIQSTNIFGMKNYKTYSGGTFKKKFGKG